MSDVSTKTLWDYSPEDDGDVTFMSRKQGNLYRSQYNFKSHAPFSLYDMLTFGSLICAGNNLDGGTNK